MSILSSRSIFVETSIQIARVLAEPAQRAAIEQQLKQTNVAFVTASYVYMEYQRSLIADFAHVHRSFRQARTLSEAMRFVFTGTRGFRPRSLLRCGQIASLAYGEQEVVQLADATALLELYLRVLLKRVFWRHVIALPDTIDCDLIRIGLLPQPDHSYQVAATCRKETAACQLPAFLREQHTKLQTISDYLAAHPKSIKEQSRVEQLLRAVQRDPRSVLGQSSCWPLGDLIILLHVPPACAVWSLDADFVALTTALGLPLFSP